MHIEHIALYTEDLERLKEFYISYFGAAANSGYHNEKTGLRTYFLSFGDGARLEIMTRPQVAKAENPQYPTGYIHLAFALGSSAAVDELTEKLRADGYCVASEPRVTGDGYYESCVLDPDGNPIELVA